MPTHEVFAARVHNARVIHPLKNTSLFSIFSPLHKPPRFVLAETSSHHTAATYLVQREVDDILESKQVIGHSPMLMA